MNHKIKLDGQNIKFGNGQNIEVELTEEQIIELHSRLQNKGEKYFFPKQHAERFYYLGADEIGGGINHRAEFDEDRINRGVFRTEEQAKKEDEKRLALVRMWKWVQENGLYWEPDWGVCTEYKYYPSYDYFHKTWILSLDFSVRNNFVFPYFRTKEDCQKFIDNNLSDLNLFV